MDHQDWETVVLYKPKTVVNKNKPHKTNAFQQLDSDEPPPPQKIDKKISLQISQMRASKGFTQKKLANMLNIQPSVINDYENGKVIPDKNMLRKIMTKIR